VWFIVDIGMRMLQPRELYRAQGFPEWYIIDRDYRVKYAKDKQVAGAATRYRRRSPRRW
jgi:DNA (cytosine-5)-methyltransferase 1